MHLCLNGHTIQRGHSGACVIISSSGTLHLYDCSDDHSGSILGNSDISGQLNRGVTNEGTFVMNGGTISGHSASFCSGVYTIGTFVMNGGTISGNRAGRAGGGVCARSNSNEAVKVGGSSEIINNFERIKGVDHINNLQLDVTKMTILDDFTGGIRLSVWTLSPPTKEKPRTMTNYHSVDCSRYFFSDNSAFEIINTGSGSEQYLRLQVMHDHEWSEDYSSDDTHHWR